MLKLRWPWRSVLTYQMSGFMYQSSPTKRQASPISPHIPNISPHLQMYLLIRLVELRVLGVAYYWNADMLRMTDMIREDWYWYVRTDRWSLTFGMWGLRIDTWSLAFGRWGLTFGLIREAWCLVGEDWPSGPPYKINCDHVFDFKAYAHAKKRSCDHAFVFEVQIYANWHVCVRSSHIFYLKKKRWVRLRI